MFYKEYVSAKRTDIGIEYSVLDINKEHDDGPIVGERRLVDFHFIMNQLSMSMGDMLTIIDASITDQFQRKALKDLIRKSFSERINDAVSWTVNTVTEPELSDEEFKSLKEVSIDEVLGLEKPRE